MSRFDWITALHALETQGRPFVLVTIVRTEGSTPREPGTHMFVDATGRLTGTIGGGRLESLAVADALACLARKQCLTVRYPLGARTAQCCGGVVELFMEPLCIDPELYIFGAGHVGQALVRVMEGTPFRVNLVDERTEWIDHPSIPNSVKRHKVPPLEFASTARWDTRDTYAVVMTHSHDLDEELIADLLRRSWRYTGLIGSETKWARFQHRMALRGFDAATIATIRCPIGIPIGGKAPQEVAISIAAELLRTHHETGAANCANMEPTLPCP